MDNQHEEIMADITKPVSTQDMADALIRKFALLNFKVENELAPFLGKVTHPDYKFGPGGERHLRNSMTEAAKLDIIHRCIDEILETVR